VLVPLKMAYAIHRPIAILSYTAVELSKKEETRDKMSFVHKDPGKNKSQIEEFLAIIEALKYRRGIPLGNTASGLPVEAYLVGEGGTQETAASELIVLAPTLQDKKVVPPLLIALQDKDTYVRRVAFIALCELSAPLHGIETVEALIQAQPTIEEDMGGHPIMERPGESRTAAGELLMLLKKLEEASRPEPFLSALKSKNAEISAFATAVLLKMEKAKDVVDILEHSAMSEDIFDAVFIRFEEMDSEFALTTLIQILQHGSPWMRVFAAQRLKNQNYTDSRAVDALSEWNIFLQKEFAGKSPICPDCGKESSQQIKSGDYWCSWCGKEFGLGATWAAQQC
jgi:HEAT repeat protein